MCLTLEGLRDSGLIPQHRLGEVASCARQSLIKPPRNTLGGEGGKRLIRCGVRVRHESRDQPDLCVEKCGSSVSRSRKPRDQRFESVYDLADSFNPASSSRNAMISLRNALTSSRKASRSVCATSSAARIAARLSS